LRTGGSGSTFSTFYGDFRNLKLLIKKQFWLFDGEIRVKAGCGFGAVRSIFGLPIDFYG
jgi:hypothetical protein